MKKTLIISEVIDKTSAVLHSDGLKLYNSIVSVYKDGVKLEIAFNGLSYCTTAFLNASIGKFLLETDKPEMAMKNINYSGISDELINEKIKQLYEFISNEKKRAIHDQYVSA